MLPRIIIVAGAYMMNLLPQRGFQTSKRPAPIAHTKAPIFGPHNIAARNEIKFPICQTPRGGGIGKLMDVVMYTKAVNTAVVDISMLLIRCIVINFIIVLSII
jgi:hypothetical protein